MRRTNVHLYTTPATTLLAAGVTHFWFPELSTGLVIAISCLSAAFVMILSIVLHEFGHWGMARAVGIPITEFSAGFGKVLYEFPGTWKGTKFKIRAAPLGGMVVTKEEELAGTAVWRRAFFIAGGPAMNFLLSILFFFALFAGWGMPQKVDQVYIAHLETQLARDAGLKEGDRILQVDGAAVLTPEAVVQALSAHSAKPAVLLIGRQSGDVSANLSVSVSADQSGKFGIEVASVSTTQFTHKTLAQAGVEAVKSTVAFSYQTVVVLAKIAHIVPQTQGEHFSAGDISSLIGIVQVGGKMAQKGLPAFLFFSAILNLSLGVMNLFPLPGLDGGQLVFLAVEKVFGRPVPAKWQGHLTIWSFSTLAAVAVYATWNDLTKNVGDTWATPLLIVIVCGVLWLFFPSRKH